MASVHRRVIFDDSRKLISRSYFICSHYFIIMRVSFSLPFHLPSGWYPLGKGNLTPQTSANSTLHAYIRSRTRMHKTHRHTRLHSSQLIWLIPIQALHLFAKWMSNCRFHLNKNTGCRLNRQVLISSGSWQPTASRNTAATRRVTILLHYSCQADSTCDVRVC